MSPPPPNLLALAGLGLLLGPRMGARPYRERGRGGGRDHPVRAASSRPALAGGGPPGRAAFDRARWDGDPALRAGPLAPARALARRRSAPSSPQPRARDRARACAPARRCRSLTG